MIRSVFWIQDTDRREHEIDLQPLCDKVLDVLAELEHEQPVFALQCLDDLPVDVTGGHAADAHAHRRAIVAHSGARACETCSRSWTCDVAILHLHHPRCIGRGFKGRW
jgi:hypothetical protein